MVLCRECNVNFYFLADFSANKLLFETRDKCTGTDCQRIICTLAAFECYAINETFEIDYCHIAIFNSSIFNCNCSSTVLALSLDLSVDFFFSNCHISCFYFNTFIFAERYFRLKSYFCSEDERFAGFDLNYVDLWAGYDFFFAFCNSVLVSCWDKLVSCIFIEDSCAIHLLDHFARHFTFTETRNANFVLVFLVSCLNCLFEFFSGNFDCKFRHIFFQFFNL